MNDYFLGFYFLQRNFFPIRAIKFKNLIYKLYPYNIQIWKHELSNAKKLI